MNRLRSYTTSPYASHAILFNRNEIMQLGATTRSSNLQKIELPVKNVRISATSSKLDENTTYFATNRGLFYLKNLSGIQEIEAFSQKPVLKVATSMYTIVLTDEGLFSVNTVTRDVQKIPSPSKDKITDIFAGYEHCLVLTTNALYGFGKSNSFLNGTVTVIEPSQMVEIKAFSGKTITHIAVGYKQNIVVTNEKSGFYSWGNNQYNQLGLGYETFEPTLVDFFEDHQIFQVVCGSIHTLVWTSKGLFGFGYNDDFQLALGHKNTTPKPEPIPFFNDKTILEIFATGWHSFVITASGIYGFGRNTNREYSSSTNPSGAPTLLTEIATSNFDQWSFIPQQNFPELLIPLLLCRELDPNSLFYKEYLPLDLFKLIVDFAQLGKIPRNYSHNMQPLSQNVPTKSLNIDNSNTKRDSKPCQMF